MSRVTSSCFFTEAFLIFFFSLLFSPSLSPHPTPHPTPISFSSFSHQQLDTFVNLLLSSDYASKALFETPWRRAARERFTVEVKDILKGRVVPRESSKTGRERAVTGYAMDVMNRILDSARLNRIHLDQSVVSTVTSIRAFDKLARAIDPSADIVTEALKILGDIQGDARKPTKQTHDGDADDFSRVMT